MRYRGLTYVQCGRRGLFLVSVREHHCVVNKRLGWVCHRMLHVADGRDHNRCIYRVCVTREMTSSVTTDRSALISTVRCRMGLDWYRRAKSIPVPRDARIWNSIATACGQIWIWYLLHEKHFRSNTSSMQRMYLLENRWKPDSRVSAGCPNTRNPRKHTF